MDAASITLTPAQQAHIRLMQAVLGALQDTPMVLKGGTALLLCYGLDRFSEDLDFDSPKKLNLESRLQRLLAQHTTTFKIDRTKDTETVLRYRINYTVPAAEGRLKIEVSFRDGIDATTVVEQKGIRTYQPATLLNQKIRAFQNRTAARDLFDIHFLTTRYLDHFDPEALDLLRRAFTDLNQIETRFRPAFEEDDLFANHPDLLPQLMLSIQSTL